MSYKLEITRGDNGYKLRCRDEADDGQKIWREEYIQDDEGDGLKSGEELLWWIMDYFSFSGSKHDPERIRVVREKQES